VNRSSFSVQPVQQFKALVNPITLFVLLSCLNAASLSNQARAQSSARLQPLLNDTVAQLKLVYHSDAGELHRRYEEVSKAVELWRTADRNEENNRRLETWLRAAIRRSMPGSHEPLPRAPEFASLPEPAPVVIAPAPEHAPVAAAPAAASPAPTNPTPIGTPVVTPPQTTPSAPPDRVEASKPVADGPTMNGNETELPATQPFESEEEAADDALPEMGDLPDIEETPDLGELPDAGELPELEEDPAMIEALGDPFVDDP
jgi:hypothetical protein